MPYTVRKLYKIKPTSIKPIRDGDQSDDDGGDVDYRIDSNKRRGAYLIFHATIAALIRGRRLFKHCTWQIYFFDIFIQRYTFYLLIFQWTDTKLIANLELRANSFVVVEQFTTFSQFRCHCLLLYQNLRAFKENKLPMLF